ncbi:8945_t:CDS:1, partial [Funneliformis caledonium]
MTNLVAGVLNDVTDQGMGSITRLSNGDFLFVTYYLSQGLSLNA